METLAQAAALSLGSLDAANDLHLTAIHEAGHSIAYLNMGIEMEFITVAATAERSGYSKAGKRPIVGLDFATASVAGPVAQAIATFAAASSSGEPTEDVWVDHRARSIFDGGMGDFQDLIDLAGSQEAAGDLFGDLETPVLEMLTESWPRVIALAETVVAHPELTLTGPEMLEAIEASLPAT